MYEPKPGHVITFANTIDANTLYHVDSADTDRVEVTNLADAANGATGTIRLSLHLFREMGGSPVVLSDEDMATMEALYTLHLVEALEFLEMVMLMAATFGEEAGMMLLPPSEIKMMESSLDRFKAGIEFLRNARTDAYYRQAADIANGR